MNNEQMNVFWHLKLMPEDQIFEVVAALIVEESLDINGLLSKIDKINKDLQTESE